MGPGADAEIIARRLSRSRTCEDFATATNRSGAGSRCLTARHQSPDPSDVLRSRLQCEATCADAHWSAAPRRFTARSLARADQKRNAHSAGSDDTMTVVKCDVA